MDVLPNNSASVTDTQLSRLQAFDSRINWGPDPRTALNAPTNDCQMMAASRHLLAEVSQHFNLPPSTRCGSRFYRSTIGAGQHYWVDPRGEYLVIISLAGDNNNLMQWDSPRRGTRVAMALSPGHVLHIRVATITLPANIFFVAFLPVECDAAGRMSERDVREFKAQNPQFEEVVKGPFFDQE